jgi:hypothetical protein
VYNEKKAKYEKPTAAVLAFMPKDIVTASDGFAGEDQWLDTDGQNLVT